MHLKANEASSMFEVEKKFKLSNNESKKLLEGAEFISEKTFTDIYYDTPEYSLTKNDIWLRKRGEEFELKIPMHQMGQHLLQQYQEIEGEEKIREIFSIAPIVDFETDILAFSYEPFCVCTTTRRKFKKDKFTIDLDLVEYGDFSYELAEIELLVETKEQMDEAAREIEEFASSLGLKQGYVRGKVLEYLARKCPAHFEALVASGVIKEEN
jgi:adenylate cyclase class IV